LKYTVGSAEITYGNFLQAIVNFLIIAFVLFLVIRAYNNMRRKEEVKPPAKEELPRDTVLLTEIRDLLRSNPGTGTTIDRPATK
jgi:large conductance mechanosensitive channel